MDPSTMLMWLRRHESSWDERQAYFTEVIVAYLDAFGCPDAWYTNPGNGLRDDDFHAAGFRAQTVRTIHYGGRLVFLSLDRISSARAQVEKSISN